VQDRGGPDRASCTGSCRPAGSSPGGPLEASAGHENRNAVRSAETPWRRQQGDDRCGRRLSWRNDSARLSGRSLTSILRSPTLQGLTLLPKVVRNSAGRLCFVAHIHVRYRDQSTPASRRRILSRRTLTAASMHQRCGWEVRASVDAWQASPFQRRSGQISPLGSPSAPAHQGTYRNIPTYTDHVACANSANLDLSRSSPMAVPCHSGDR
jgi:hypothetical protein